MALCDADVQGIIQLALTKCKYDKNPDLWKIVECAMDELDYHGDEAVDDIVDIVLSIREQTTKKTMTIEEKELKELRKAEKTMDRVAKKALSLPLVEDSDDWNPTQPKPNADWFAILDRIDILNKRLEDAHATTRL